MTFVTSPKNGQKELVSLFNEKSQLNLEGYLRKTEEDPMGTTGINAQIEIKEQELIKVRKSKGIWQIYPAIKSRTSNRKEGAHEINI